MSEETALPRLKLPKQPYRSRFYRDNAFGSPSRLTEKPLNVISQKNADTSTIVNNLFAGLESINDTQSQLDSTSQFEVQFSKGKKLMNEFSKDLQFEKKSSSARTQIQQHKNNQSYHVPESYAGTKGGNNGSFSSKKQTAHCSEAVTIAADKAKVDNGVGNSACTYEAIGDGRGFDELEGSLLVDVEALVVEADMSPVDKFGITYDAETSVINSTPNPSKPSENCQPKVRLCFNTSVTPIAVKSPNVRAERKNYVSNAFGVVKPKSLSTCFGEKPTVSGLTQPPQVKPHIFAPKCNDFEFELMEEESFNFVSWMTIPRKISSQRPVEQKNKSVLVTKNAKEQEKQQKAGRNQVAVTDGKQKELLNDHLTPCIELEDRKSCKQNEQVQLEESAKSSGTCPKKKNVDEELQNKPSTASKLSLTSTVNTKLGYEKQDQYTKCMNLESVPLAETAADNNENNKLAGLEKHQPRTSLFRGKKKESTLVSGSPVLSRLPQTIKSKRPDLCASEIPALLNNQHVDNQQNAYLSENVVPSTSGLEKQQKKSSFLSFGIKPAFSALPHVKKINPVTSAPNLGFEFDVDEENFCFESLSTIPMKAFVQKQDPAEQEKKPVTDTKKTIKNNRMQKVAKARKLTIQSKKVDDEKHVVHSKKNKEKNENQPRKRPAYLLKNNIEKEQEEEHNELSSHSKCFIPRQKKIKAARSNKKAVVEFEGSGEQEKIQEPEELHQESHLHIKEYNYTEKAELFDHSAITSKRVSESESSRNLSPTDSKYLVASKQTKLGKKQGRQRKASVIKSKRAKEKEEIKAHFYGQENENRMEGCRMSKLDIMTAQNLPTNKSPVNDCNENSFPNSGSENKRRAKKQHKQMAIELDRTKTWVNEATCELDLSQIGFFFGLASQTKIYGGVRKISKKESQPIKQNSCKKNLSFYHEPDENLVQDDTFKIRSKSGRLTRAPQRWWEVQHANDNLQKELKTNYSPEQKAKLQERMTKRKSAESQNKKKMVLKEASSAQTEPLETERCSSEEQIGEKDVFKNICYPDNSPQDSLIGSPSIKNQSRKTKCTSASTKPKKRLFLEAEEKAKKSDMNKCKKQRYRQKQKVHNVIVSDKSEMQQNVHSNEHTSSAYVAPIPLSSLQTSLKPFQESSACLSTTYVVKSPQKPAHGHPEIIKVSSGSPNLVLMSPRNSPDQSCTKEQVPSATPYHVAMRTRRYQDKAVPSQPCGHTLDENKEGNESECSPSVRGTSTLKQGCLYRDLPVFNKSGPGPSVNNEESSDAGDYRNLVHEAYDHEKPPKGEHLMSTCVWGEKENNEIFVDCVKTSEMCNFFYPLKTKYDDNRSIAICKSLNWKTFSSGKLVLGPYKEKGCQMVYKDTMIFHILKGDLGITIYHTTYHLKEGDYFFVPSGNTYNVTNLQDTEAVLLFTQLKGAKME
ncbi:axoneme-associated protein mst101(2)-like isoform X2 [Narcine bancroftii]|uniref:axoneme-associated protein mst101(2)-like isoform X2 n=1 Tax=Narcine bancroftii TaxID=1343680 RepID=UPI0038319E34